MSWIASRFPLPYNEHRTSKQIHVNSNGCCITSEIKMAIVLPWWKLLCIFPINRCSKISKNFLCPFNYMTNEESWEKPNVMWQHTLSRRTASTARFAKWSLCCVRILELNVVLAIFNRSSLNFAGSLLVKTNGEHYYLGKIHDLQNDDW